MIRILAVLPDVKDATTFYRAVVPLSALSKQGVTYIEEKVINWSHIVNADIVFLQRPLDQARLEVARLAKSVGKPLWLDYDDDLVNIPESNPYKLICDRHSESFKELLELADVISVSTEQLKFNLGHPTKSVTIPNAYAEELFPYANEMELKRNNYVLWRGSSTHKLDLREVAKELIQFNQENTKHPLCFLGYEPEFVTMSLNADSYRVIPGVPLFNYFRLIHTLAPLITIVPLVDDEFNRCKSNIAWIEATHAGSLVLARNLPEFQKPGVITFNEPGDFYAKLTEIVSGKVNILENVKVSREFISDTLTLTKVNKKRMQIINRLLAK